VRIIVLSTGYPRRISSPYLSLSVLVTVRKVLDDPKLAEELLPTQGGFFFGSTEYDECYFAGLRETEEILANVVSFVKENPAFHLYYQSSW
jgi:hypothetical protein